MDKCASSTHPTVAQGSTLQIESNRLTQLLELHEVTASSAAEIEDLEWCALVVRCWATVDPIRTENPAELVEHNGPPSGEPPVLIFHLVCDIVQTLIHSCRPLCSLFDISYLTQLARARTSIREVEWSSTTPGEGFVIHPVDATAGAIRSMRRRGLAAGLVGLVAGYLVKGAERTAFANNNDPVTVGNNFTGTLPTQITSTGSVSISGVGSGAGSTGVQGSSTSGYGLYGTSSSNVGIAGTSSSNWGVYGFSTSNTGVVGTSTSGWAIWGNSTGANGVVGQTTTGVGVYGVSTGSGRAAQFDGDVVVNGNFQATGIKSAVVPTAAGGHRRLYCQESPEPWFEDFGEVGLNNNGQATVRLDPEFAALVKSDKYYVFLTENGDAGGLYVANQNAAGFQIRSRGSGGGNTVYYRVVARRKDIVGTRLERVDLTRDLGRRRDVDSRGTPKPPTPPGRNTPFGQ